MSNLHRLPEPVPPGWYEEDRPFDRFRSWKCNGTHDLRVVLWDDLIYAGFPKEGGHILGVAKRDIPPGGSLTIILDPKGGINYADPRCDLGWLVGQA